MENQKKTEPTKKQEELVAVIAASIGSELGMNVSDIKITAIKKL